MKRIYTIILLSLCIFVVNPKVIFAQTKIAKEQIEDAFVLRSGDSVYGDLEAATSTIKASTFDIVSGHHVFKLYQNDNYAVIRSSGDLYLDPTDSGLAGAKIIPVTMMEFSDYLGDKIRFYSHSYAIGVSPFDLDIRSDRNIKFHSDTHPDAMILDGDTGRLELSGPLKLPVYTTLPAGTVGELIYFDHASDDNQDGVYVYTSSGWSQL